MALSLAIAGLTACGTVGNDPAVPAKLPPITSLDQRATANVDILTVDGYFTFQASSGAIRMGSALYLQGSDGVCEWAIYQLTPPAGTTPTRVSVSAGGEGAWYGVADYALQKWQCSGPFAADQDLDLTGLNCLSPGGHVYVAVLCTGTATAIVYSVTLEYAGNLPPVASFTATPQTGAPGTPVTLDAVASSDPDGSIVDYAWDLDGDGSFETDTLQVPTASTSLPDPAGSLSVGLQVTDGGGATHSANRLLQSAAQWQVITVSSDAGNGLFNLTTVGGYPAIAYSHQGTTRTPFFAWSTQADGTSGWNTVEVESVSDSDMGRLADINGHPALAYRSMTGQWNATLKYAYSSTDGSSGWNSLTLPNNNWASYPSLALVGGKPAISFADDNGSVLSLHYYRSSQDDGSGGWTGLEVDPGGSVFTTSLIDCNGKPAIAFCTTDWDIRFAYSSLADGSGGWSVVTVALGTDYKEPSAAMINGKPAIAYWAAVDKILRYAYSSQPDGSAGWNSVDILDTDLVGPGALALVGGYPAVSIGDFGGGPLRFGVSSATDGSSGWATADVATQTGIVTSSLAEVNGNPAVAFVDGASGQVKYAVLVQ